MGRCRRDEGRRLGAAPAPPPRRAVRRHLGTALLRRRRGDPAQVGPASTRSLRHPRPGPSIARRGPANADTSRASRGALLRDGPRSRAGRSALHRTRQARVGGPQLASAKVPARLRHRRLVSAACVSSSSLPAPSSSPRRRHNDRPRSSSPARSRWWRTCRRRRCPLRRKVHRSRSPRRSPGPARPRRTSPSCASGWCRRASTWAVRGRR